MAIDRLHSTQDFERRTGFVSQSTEIHTGDELGDWRHRMCGAVALYGSFVRLGLDVPAFNEFLDTLLEHDCYREGDGWVQPYQSKFARDMAGLRAVSLTVQHNRGDAISDNINSMIRAGRLPDDLDSAEVKLFESELFALHDMPSVVEWLNQHPEWLMIASVEPGYVSKQSRHQLLIQSDGRQAYAIDSAGRQTNLGTLFTIGDDFFKYATGNCILLSRKNENTKNSQSRPIPYVSYKDETHTFDGVMHHIDMLRTPGILDAFIVLPKSVDLDATKMVLHIQGVRYQEKAIAKSSTPQNDPFYTTLASTLLSEGVGFTRLGIHGVGSAGGTLSEESIESRSRALVDYLGVLNDLGFRFENLTISAQSQGCLVAIRALDKCSYSVRRLKLVSPVLFSEEAELAPFDIDYTKALRVPNNHRRSNVASRLRTLCNRGIDISLVWMEHDSPTPIPESVRREWGAICTQLDVQQSIVPNHYHNFALEPPRTRQELEAGLPKPTNDLPAVEAYARSLIV